MAATSKPPDCGRSTRLLRGHPHTYRPTLASSSARRARQTSMVAMCASGVGTSRLLDRCEGGKGREPIVGLSRREMPGSGVDVVERGGKVSNFATRHIA